MNSGSTSVQLFMRIPSCFGNLENKGDSYIHLLAKTSGSEIPGKQGGILTLGGILRYNCTDHVTGITMDKSSPSDELSSESDIPKGQNQNVILKTNPLGV